MPLTKLLAFGRVSIAQQTDSCSHELQSNAITSYVNAFANLELIEPPIWNMVTETGYVDEDRTLFYNILRRVLQGEADGLIVYRLDRFARSVKHGCEIMDTLQKAGKELISVQDRIDTTTPMGKAMFQMVLVFAELERNTFMYRSSTARKHKRALRTQEAPAGYWVGGNYPYGYEPGAKGTQGFPLKVNPEEQQVILDMQYWRQTGHSLESVAEMANDRGYKTRKGGWWCIKSVSKVLLKQA